MNTTRILATALVFVLGAGVAVAQDDGGTVESLLDRASRWLRDIGDRTDQWLAPRIGDIGENEAADFSGLETALREFSQTYPTAADVNVAITSEFGEIRVETWDSPVVQVRATISVGAESLDVAEEIAESIHIGVESLDGIRVRTSYPNTSGAGSSAMVVDYTITVPRKAHINARNHFGDIRIQGVAGPVAANVHIGGIELRDLEGPVTVRAWGEYPLLASGLKAGGAFVLQGTNAEFEHVAGPLRVSNFMGSVTVREPAADTSVDIANESGPIHIYVPENARPDITASALSGAIESDLALDVTQRGEVTLARRANADSTRVFGLHTSFDTVYVHQAGLKPAPAPAQAAGAEVVTDTLEEIVSAGEGHELAVNAVLGNVSIVGTDTDRLTVRAQRAVKIAESANAQACIEALTFKVSNDGQRVLVETDLAGDPSELGCTQYRIDLELLCPRAMALTVNGENGHTQVRGMGETINVKQGTGSVTISDCKREDGPIEVVNGAGGVTVRNVQGPVTIEVTRGVASTQQVFGSQTVTTTDGRTLVDAPMGPVTITSRGGGVRVIALDGVHGDYAIDIVKGDLGLVLAPSADVALDVRTQNGEVHSAVPLGGSIDRGARQFTGTLKEGKYRLALRAEDGDITID